MLVSGQTHANFVPIKKHAWSDQIQPTRPSCIPSPHLLLFEPFPCWHMDGRTDHVDTLLDFILLLIISGVPNLPVVNFLAYSTLMNFRNMYLIKHLNILTNCFWFSNLQSIHSRWTGNITYWQPSGSWAQLLRWHWPYIFVPTKWTAAIQKALTGPNSVDVKGKLGNVPQQIC